MEIKVENKYGFIEPFVTRKDYILGGFSNVPKEILQPSGDWTDFLVAKELQNLYFETFNCTGFSTNNAIEMLMRRKFGFEPNYSDRATGINAGTFPPGNDPNTVAEAIRSKGLLLEEEMPFSQLLQTPEDYYAPSPLPQNLLDKCLLWKRKYNFLHEWV